MIETDENVADGSTTLNRRNLRCAKAIVTTAALAPALPSSPSTIC
jgi:hypothetical protein